MVLEYGGIVSPVRLVDYLLVLMPHADGALEHEQDHIPSDAVG